MPDETLMSDAPEGGGAAGAGAPAPAAEAQQPAGAPAPAADGSTPEGEAKAAEVKQPEGAPEKYEFQAPEGLALDEAVTGALGEVAKELNLSQDAAQKVVDKMAPLLAQRQADQVAAVQAEWREQATSDKEFGGEKLAENLGVAKQALDAFGSPELKQMLDQTGLGNHPEVIRFFVKTGRAMSEDRLVTGKTAPTASNDARRLYGASNMNP